MIFTLYQGGKVKIDNTHTIINIHPLAHILDIAKIFTSLSQPHHVTAFHISPGDNHQSTGGQSERMQGQAKMAVRNSFSYMCTEALHSFRSFSHWRAASTVIPLLPKATFTPSIQPNLGLPRTIVKSAFCKLRLVVVIIFFVIKCEFTEIILSLQNSFWP